MLVCRFGRWLHGCLVKSITDTLNQKVLYDPSGMLDRPGVAVSTVHGDLPWCDGLTAAATSRNCLPYRGWIRCRTSPRSPACWTGDSGHGQGRDHWHASVGNRRTKDRLSHAQRAFNRLQAGPRALVEQSIGIWPTPGAASLARAAVPGAVCPPGHRRWSAWADGCTKYPMWSSITDTLTDNLSPRRTACLTAVLSQPRCSGLAESAPIRACVPPNLLQNEPTEPSATL